MSRYRSKAVCIVAAASLTLLAACSSSGSTAASSATTSGASSGGAAAASKIPPISFVSSNTGNGFFIAAHCAMVQQAAKYHLSVKYYGSTPYAPSAQLPVLNSVAATNPKVLIVSPTDPTALDPPLQQMKSTGAQIFTYDATTANPALSNAFVHSNEYQAGYNGGLKLAKSMGDKGTALIIDIIAGNPLVVARTGGMRAALVAHGITVLPTQYDGESATNDTSIVNSTLAAHPNLGGIAAMYSEATDGVIAALKGANKMSQVKVVGYDGEPNLFNWVRNGTLVALVVSSAHDDIVQVVKWLLEEAEGKKISPTTVELTMPVVTKQNINEPQIADQEYTAC
jgi:ABC-type sugar transport system substrate-binding protein